LSSEQTLPGINAEVLAEPFTELLADDEVERFVSRDAVGLGVEA
jgi:hypothetical protein